jgi:hypothetical protein
MEVAQNVRMTIYSLLFRHGYTIFDNRCKDTAYI